MIEVMPNSMGLRTWDVHLHSPGRRVTDAGEFLGTYQDIGDDVDDEPDIGSVIYVGLTRYEVVHYEHEGTTGGKLVVEAAAVTAESESWHEPSRML